MEKTLSSQATNGREGRLRAWDLHQKGWKQRDIAEALGVSQRAVSQWLKRGREGGVEGLRHQPPPGAPPRLSSEQREQLLELVSQGAEAFGFPGDVWTQPRVATLIRDRFGVSYHPAHVGRILKACGWSSQKPVHLSFCTDQIKATEISPVHESGVSFRGQYPRPQSQNGRGSGMKSEQVLATTFPHDH